MTGVYAAVAAVPALVLLYFLKLKRREVVVSSTLLWLRAVRDMQVNAPFQKLRRNLLLLLQLLAMAAVLLALAGPVARMTGGQARRVVILIDRSASMNCRDAGGSRLDLARKQARLLVESLRGRQAFSLTDKADRAMVVAFDRHAKVLCNFTSDKRQLLAAIDAVTPTDGPSFLGEAVTLARAFSGKTAGDEGGQTGLPGAKLELFSDGRIADLADIFVSPGEITFHRLGGRGDNAAITSLQARRSYEKAEEVSVFASLADYASPSAAPAGEGRTCDVQLSIDGNVKAVRTVTIPPARLGPDGGIEPGKVSVSYVLPYAQAGVVELRLLTDDLLAEDNAAWAVLQAPRRLRALLVCDGSRRRSPLETALRACPLEKLDVTDPDEFRALDPDLLAVTQPYEVIVLDCCSPAVSDVISGDGTGKALPRGRYLVFGDPPADSGVTVGRKLSGQVVVDWRSQHPLLQFVDLSNLYAADGREMIAPRDVDVLARFTDTPAVLLARRKGSVFVLAGFDPGETNWPFEPGFVMFCYNALNYLGAEVGQDERKSLAVGEPISVRVAGAEGRTIVFTTPDGREIPLPAKGEAGGATARFPQTDRVGIYRVALAADLSDAYAVSMLDAAESDVSPAGEITMSGRKIAPAEAIISRSNVALWPLLAVVALAVACVEWFVYTHRAKV
jgi:hypothetical protein